MTMGRLELSDIIKLTTMKNQSPQVCSSFMGRGVTLIRE